MHPHVAIQTLMTQKAAMNVKMDRTTIQENERLLSASLLRLRMKAPFFATLALFARFVATSSISTAATDGLNIYYNPDFLKPLSSAEQDGLLLHEVLHAALLHTVRRGVREKDVWNIAADIVVNGIIAQQSGFALPIGGVRDQILEKLSVEEAYELLLQEQKGARSLDNPDLLDSALSERGSGSKQAPDNSTPDDTELNSAIEEAQNARAGEGAEANADTIERLETTLSNQGTGKQPEQNATDAEKPLLRPSTISAAQKAQTEAHWQNAIQQATMIARTTQQGTLPAGIAREVNEIVGPQLNWKTHLWRYLVQTPSDFQGFDRRFVHQGLYLESLQGESVQVYLCVDTSGSISNKLLELFFAEVHGILSAYPHLKCELYYADADIYGPYAIAPGKDIPPPKGGGGTSFVPFFKTISDQWDQLSQSVCIYLTDGYGTFPSEDVLELPVLWVVTPGGLPLEDFPFGEAVRLLSDA